MSRRGIKETRAGLGLPECPVYQELQWVSPSTMLAVTETLFMHLSHILVTVCTASIHSSLYNIIYRCCVSCAVGPSVFSNHNNHSSRILPETVVALFPLLHRGDPALTGREASPDRMWGAFSPNNWNWFFQDVCTLKRCFLITGTKGPKWRWRPKGS